MSDSQSKPEGEDVKDSEDKEKEKVKETSFKERQQDGRDWKRGGPSFLFLLYLEYLFERTQMTGGWIGSTIKLPF